MVMILLIEDGGMRSSAFLLNNTVPVVISIKIACLAADSMADAGHVKAMKIKKKTASDIRPTDGIALPPHLL